MKFRLVIKMDDSYVLYSMLLAKFIIPFMKNLMCPIKIKPPMIDKFDVSDAFILDPNEGKYRLAFFVSVENKQLPPIRIDGDFKVFMNKNDGKKSFWLAIALDERNE